MKKKGFTLVELLAVIAILAILVIIALPNVMGMFNQAKKNSFTTEIKEIFKTAQQQWISDSMMQTTEIVYYRQKSGDTVGTATSSLGDDHFLDMTGRTELQYAISFTKAGKVNYYFATDGTYAFEYNDGELQIEQIGDDSSTGVRVMTLTDENCTDAYVSCENDDTNGFTCTLAGEGDTCSLN